MEKEGEKVTGVNPAAGENAATQLPFDYWDVAEQVVENRDKWDPVFVYYNKETHELFAWPYEVQDNCCVELFKWSVVDDEVYLESEDLRLPGRDEDYDDFYELDPQKYDTFAEYLQDNGEYDNRVSAYLVRKMEKDNLMAKWREQIEEAKKNE